MNIYILLSFIYCVCKSVVSAPSEAWYDVSWQGNADSWLELRKVGTRSSILSTDYLASGNRDLQFRFPFYGEPIKKVAATTQGFLYMGTFHQKLYETQYVAPLMANFKPYGRIPTQDVRHFQNNTLFVTQWSQMLLDEQRSAGYFTFQAQLHKDGTIKFVYKDIPMPIKDISPKNHLVKLGISDAYVVYGMDRSQNYKPYNTITLNLTKVTSNTTFTLTPIETCTKQKSCRSCLSHSGNCRWCSSLDRCSTGQDKYHQLWIASGCNRNAVSNVCSGNSSKATPQTRWQSPSTDAMAHVTPGPIVNPTKKSSMVPYTGWTVVYTLLISTACILAILFVSAALLIYGYGIKRRKLVDQQKKLVARPISDGCTTLLKPDPQCEVI